MSNKCSRDRKALVWLGQHLGWHGLPSCPRYNTPWSGWAGENLPCSVCFNQETVDSLRGECFARVALHFSQEEGVADTDGNNQ